MYICPLREDAFYGHVRTLYACAYDSGVSISRGKPRHRIQDLFTVAATPLGLYYTILYYTTLHYTIQDYTILYYTILYYSILLHNMLETTY